MAFDLSTWTTAKYRYSFVGDEGTSYIAEIHEDGFSGSVATVDIVGRGSINTRWATEGDDEFAPMMTSETSLALYDTGEALASDLIDALDTVDNKYLMVIRQSGNLKWVGRIDPESINFDEDGPVKLSVTATDGLGRLENKPYITNTDGSGVDEGSATLVSVIADVLSSTGFGLDFYISSSLVPRASTAITAIKNPLQYVWVNKIAFTSNRDKEERGLVSKLSVLEAICKAWGLRVFQSEGAWHLIQVSHFAQNSHRKWQYNSAGVLQGYSDVDPRVTISNEDIKRSESTANILPGYKSSIVQYQHGPIRLLRSPQFEPLTISNAEAILGGNYPWSQYADVPGQIGAAQIYTLDDGTWGMGVDEINVVGGLSDKTGYDGVEIDGKGIIFANIPHSTLTTYIGNGFSAQTTDPIPDGVPLKFAASIFGLQFGNNPNPNPHLVADEWVAFQIEHAGTTTRYLKFSEDGSLEWSTTNNWCLIRNGLQPNGWASLSLDDIDNTVNNGAMTVRIGPVIYDDTDEALWQKVVWDNVQLFPELPDGQSNYDATSVVSYINNAARSEPRHVQRVVILGDGPSTYNKGSMYTNSALTTRTADWEITTTGHSGANTDVSHAEALGELMLRCMHKIRRKHNASYVGYGGILTPLNVLNRSSALWAPWEITVTWQGEYSQGSWYRAEYTSSLTNLETETGIATGAHLLSSFGRGTSSNAGFTYNRIGSSFDTLIARENDRISKVVADPVSGATVTNSGTTVHCEALTDPAGNILVLEHGDAVYFQSVKTGRIIKRFVDASENDPAYSPYAAGAITFEVSEDFTVDEYIEQNDPILPGTITGMRIDMDGISVINTHIKSDNWADAPSNGVVDENGIITTSGTDGWIITKAGEAEFNNAIIRGKIDVGGIRIGKDVGYLTGTGDEPTAGEHGIWINADNYWILDTNADPDKTYFKVGDSQDNFFWDETAGALKVSSGGNVIFDSSTAASGLALDGDLEIVGGRLIRSVTGGEVSLGPNGLSLIYDRADKISAPIATEITFDNENGSDTVTLGFSASDSGGGVWLTDEWHIDSAVPIDISTTGGNYDISLSPHGTGQIILDYASFPASDGQSGQVLSTNADGTLSWIPTSAGVTAFTDLTDTPANYTGAASKFVKVNAAANALEFVADPGYLTGPFATLIGAASDASGTPSDKHLLYYDSGTPGWVSTSLADVSADISGSNISNDEGWTSNAGTVTEVISGLGSGIDVSSATTTPTLSLNLNELGSGTIVSFSGVSAGGDSVNQSIGTINVGSFNNDAGYTTNTGTVTSVISGLGSGIDVTSATTTPTLVLNLDELSAGTIVSFAGVSSGGDSIKQSIGNIGLSSFSNDAGFTTNTGTVTSVISGTGSGIDVSLATTTPTLVLNLNELGAGTIASFAGVSAGGDSINQAIGNIALSSFNDDLSYAQSGDNISIFTNNAGYITGISSLTDIGDVSGTPADKHIVYYDSGGPGWVSQTLASALTDQNVSSLINDAGYTTNIGDITGVTTSGTSGLDGGVTSGTATLSLDFSRLTAGVVADLKAGTIAFITSGGNMRKVAASNLLFETDGVTGTFYDTEFQTVDGGTQTEYRQRTVTVTDGQITAFGSFGAWQSVVVA